MQIGTLCEGPNMHESLSLHRMEFVFFALLLHCIALLYNSMHVRFYIEGRHNFIHGWKMKQKTELIFKTIHDFSSQAPGLYVCILAVPDLHGLLYVCKYELCLYPIYPLCWLYIALPHIMCTSRELTAMLKMAGPSWAHDVWSLTSKVTNSHTLNAKYILGDRPNHTIMGFEGRQSLVGNGSLWSHSHK